MPVLKVKKNGIWEEVSGGSSVEVDASLSVEGQAADAKAVGDALAGKQPVGDYATEDYVDSAISAIPTPDVSGQIGAHNTDAASHSDIRTQLNAKAAASDVTALQNLVGDTKVSTQISNAVDPLSSEIANHETRLTILESSAISVISGVESAMTADVGEDGDVYLVTEE